MKAHVCSVTVSSLTTRYNSIPEPEYSRKLPTHSHTLIVKQLVNIEWNLQCVSYKKSNPILCLVPPSHRLLRGLHL